jgi:putative RNA 2'-phosphotransferase
MNKKNPQIDKFLSLVLRHKPEIIGIKLDPNGWVDVTTFIEKLKIYGIEIDETLLAHIVEVNPKKRFMFNGDFNKIRASQGHSVDVELGYINQEPLEILYHGTGEKSVESILKTGIEKRRRHHVHLSSDIETAVTIGQRHGKPVVFKVFAGKMYNRLLAKLK